MRGDTGFYLGERATEVSSEWRKTGRSSYRSPPMGTSWSGRMIFLTAEGWDQCLRVYGNLLPYPSPISIPVPTGTWGWVIRGIIFPSQFLKGQRPAGSQLFSNQTPFSMLFPRKTGSGGQLGPCSMIYRHNHECNEAPPEAFSGKN